ncbi:histidinol-phosphatase HisJ [Bacillus sp. Bva_UNVM-123]|uniref:histidinol-phosphatase HisJ n=1 Tax=Bacillus sp. Bva_UNVM-123 TaxID=2829798 RepID=UPI00391F9252
MKKDGHIHTPFCPHGTMDALTGYVEKAILLGYEEITFTEHAPLPKGFIDPTPKKDSAMKLEDLDIYMEEIERVKAIYRHDIIINTGLEIDYIEGYERETTYFLNQYGPFLDDAILSVHFLKNGDEYDCLDYSPENFANMVMKYGSIEHLYRVYYQTVLRSVQEDLGAYKPKRIGHMTLVKKFKKKFPIANENKEDILTILSAIQLQGYELDYNSAGFQKPLCRESYPPNWVVKEALEMGIPLIYGSDAHRIKDLGQNREQMLI